MFSVHYKNINMIFYLKDINNKAYIYYITIFVPEGINKITGKY